MPCIINSGWRPSGCAPPSSRPSHRLSRSPKPPWQRPRRQRRRWRCPSSMTCPACGEQQPRRTLCRACATDMPRYTASQAQRRQPDPEKGMAARPQGRADLAPPSPKAASSAWAFAVASPAQLFAQRPAGPRWHLCPGRRRLHLGAPGLLIGGLGLLVLAIYGTRGTVCLHDLGLMDGGRWSPGSPMSVPWRPCSCSRGARPEGRNAWGGPLPDRYRPSGCWVAWPRPGLLRSSPSAWSAASCSTGGPARPERNNRSREGGICRALRRRSRPHRHVFPEHLRLLCRKTPPVRQHGRALQRVHYRSGRRRGGPPERPPAAGGPGERAIGIPIIEVNGTLLPNNPGFGEIGRHLSGATKG